jgi:tetratricopeptide (TPR) repeat protein
VSTLHDAKPILPRWTIAALLVACGIGAYLLLPDDAQLIEDLLRDGKTAEARRQLERVSAAARRHEPDRFRRLELQVARRELPAGDPAARRAFWSQAIGSWRESNYSSDVLEEFLPVLPLLRDLPEAWRVLQPDFVRAPPSQRTRLTALLIGAALAANQPATAAAVQAAAFPAGSRPAAAALELARLWQLAGQPAAALEALGADPTAAVQARRMELLRALNRNREVFDLLRARLDAAPAAPPDPAAIEDLVAVALQAGQPADAVPYLRRLVQHRPDDLSALRRLRDVLVSAGTASAAIDVAARAVAAGGRAADDVRAQARILEWSGEPGPAFDAWLDLGRRGDREAVDRLIALNPGLYRDPDLVSALERIVPVPDRPDYTQRLARLEVALGRYDAALAHFTRYLADLPDDVPSLVEVARIQIELNRFTEADALLRRAAQLCPGDPAIERELAAALVWQGRNAEALTLYARLAARSPTEEITDPYTRLAESLGRYDELARGLRLRIQASPTPEARDYLMLAYAHEVGGDPAARRAALAEGLQRLPDDDELRLQLASALNDAKRLTEAQALLARHRRLHADPVAAALYLELMRLNDDTAAERLFLATPFAPPAARDDNVRERCALAWEALHDFAAAEKLWRELLAERPEDPARVADLARLLLGRGRTREASALLAPLLVDPPPPVLRLAAEVALAAGDPRAAEKYQSAYLTARPEAPASDWSALGDIRLSRGDRSGARSAYTEALRRLQGVIARKEGVP